MGFLVSWLAAFRRRCLQVLPPSGSRADLIAILKSCADPCILVDNVDAVRPEWGGHRRCIVWQPESGVGLVDDDELAWSPDWDAQLVRLYTSGSTGTPEPQIKTLRQLARGAQVLGARLDEELDGGVAALRSIVCSVPPQHMFGIEASTMLSLIHGVPIVEGRPLLPADVRAVFEASADGMAWITTPLHLRSIQRAGESLPHCGAVIASTMPLATSLASEIEELAAAPVLEIYGSTETGAIGMRRTARDARWRPLPGVRLEPVDDGTSVSGLHFASPQRLADHTALDDTGTFTLLGRQADLIKIAGRRASLAGLNQLLQELPGLSDGVFYLPASDAPAERLVLIYAGDPLNHAAAEAWLRERMDPVFLPRTFIRVDRLPRVGPGKVPRPALDEIYAAWRAERRTP
jgi:acyl-coenzyme A synthetase/AMP-(fatty) acid ligase